MLTNLELHRSGDRIRPQWGQGGVGVTVHGHGIHLATWLQELDQIGLHAFDGKTLNKDRVVISFGWQHSGCVEIEV